MENFSINSESLFSSKRWRAEVFAPSVESTSKFSHWEIKKLKLICSESRGAKDPAEYGTNSFIYIGLENIEAIHGTSLNIHSVTSGDVTSRSKVFTTGDILFGRLRPYLRKVFLVERPLETGLCSTEFIVIRPNIRFIDPLLLRYLLASPFFIDQISRMQNGAALPRVSAEDLFNTSIAIPPKKEQEQLGNKLLALRRERQEITERLTTIATKADELTTPR